MKKFKKPLTINIVQDNHNQSSSPKHIGYKQNKQKALLMYNEHTVASSAHNQDQQIQYDQRQEEACQQQFTEFRNKSSFQNKNFQQNQTKQLGINKQQKYKKFNVIEFQQFNVQADRANSINQASLQNPSKTYFTQKGERKHHKKQFSIQIPENEEKQDREQISVKFAFDIKNQSMKSYKQSVTKQPPAPSNKAKLNKSSNRQFIFPTNDQQSFVETITKKDKQIQKNIKYISQEQHENKLRQLNKEWAKKIQDINKNFQKERQQFYKEKSNMEKDLMIKDGQIQMLQKLITNRYSPKEGSNTISSFNNHQLISSQKPDLYKSTFPSQMKNSIYISDQKINLMETTLLQKDLQINSLMEKINELNIMLDKRSTQNEEVKISLMKSQKLNQSLKNQIYLYQKKEQSQKLTKQFYKVKETLVQVHQASKTPKGFSRSKWQEELPSQKQKSIQKSQYPLRGIDDLHKRLQSLKMNRIELQNRGKIKSQIGYSQTSKNKTKGTFDFKGKIYDRERDYINHSRMY